MTRLVVVSIGVLVTTVGIAAAVITQRPENTPPVPPAPQQQISAATKTNHKSVLGATSPTDPEQTSSQPVPAPQAAPPQTPVAASTSPQPISTIVINDNSPPAPAIVPPVDVPPDDEVAPIDLPVIGQPINLIGVPLPVTPIEDEDPVTDLTCSGRYPAEWCEIPQGSVIDTWGMYNREFIHF